MSENTARKIAILIAIVLLSYTPLAASSAQSTVANSIPSEINEYVFITLTNSPSLNVLGGTQVLLSIDWNAYSRFLSPNVSNVEFYNESWEPLYAWVESNASFKANNSYVWVRLDSNGITSEGKTTIYLAFLSNETNNFSSNEYWGESPLLSFKYGEYDNGALVFDLYTNFSGFDLPKGWGSSNMDYTVSNGMTVQTVDSFITGSIYSTSRFNPGMDVLDMDPYFSSLQGNNGSQFIGWDSGGASNILLGLFNSGSSGQYSLITSITTATGTKEQSMEISVGSSSEYQVWSMGAIGNSYAYLDLNYQTQVKITSYHFSTSSFVDFSSHTTDSFIHIQWIRIRTTPPDGIMPYVKFGPIARPYFITFTETGLPTGTSWSLSLGGVTETSSSASITFEVSNGTYFYAIQNVSGFIATNASSSIIINGYNESKLVQFSKLYVVKFSESGIPAGTEWNVTLDSKNASSRNSSISFELINGSYNYSVPSIYPYNSTVNQGHVIVNGEGMTVNLKFVLMVQFTFLEVGLPSRAKWSVYIDGTYHNSTGPLIFVNLTNGTYSYVVILPSGYKANPISGKVSWNDTVAIVNTSSPLGYEIAISALVVLIALIAAIYTRRIRKIKSSSDDVKRRKNRPG